MEKKQIKDVFNEALDKILDKRISRSQKEALIEMLTVTTCKCLEKQCIFIDRKAIGLIDYVNRL